MTPGAVILTTTQDCPLDCFKTTHTHCVIHIALSTTYKVLILLPFLKT